MTSHDFEERARRYANALPGLLRAALVDAGISSDTVARHMLGWDGKHITVPVRDARGRVVFFERWDGAAIGKPVSATTKTVEFFGWEILKQSPTTVVVAEGIHEALVLESRGIPAVAATGSGRFFKSREWAPALRAIPEVVLAYRRGEKAERKVHLLSRSRVCDLARRALPHARTLEWPAGVGPSGGAFEFFIGCRRTVDDFEVLVSAS